MTEKTLQIILSEAFLLFNITIWGHYEYCGLYLTTVSGVEYVCVDGNFEENWRNEIKYAYTFRDIVYNTVTEPSLGDRLKDVAMWKLRFSMFLPELFSSR